MIGTTLSDRAAVSTEGIKDDVGAVSGSNMIAARLSPGAISESSSSHLPPSEASRPLAIARSTAAACAQSITSSARSRIDGGMARPSAVAVLRFTIISNLVGSCTGRSPGFSPRRMRST